MEQKKLELIKEDLEQQIDLLNEDSNSF